MTTTYEGIMMKSNKYDHTSILGSFSIISAFIFMIVVNFMIPENVLSDNLKNVQINPFKARYFTENDGENPGKGNDGTIKNIESKLKITESVKRPSINFSYSDFEGINSYNFYGVWDGVMSVAGEGQSVKAHFDVSKGDVSLYLNDDLLEKWRDDSKTVQLNLKKGDNKIRIELHNHWHTTSFNVSFTDYEKLDKAAAVDLFKSIDFNSTKTVYLGAYEASARNRGDQYNEILVTIPKSSAPIFIFLNSFRAVNWVINNPHNAKIVGVALRGRSPGSTATTTSSTPIYELPTSRNSYKSSHDVQTYIGRNADYAFTEYGISSIVVPEFFQAKGNDKSKKNTDKKYGVNSFVEYLEVVRINKKVTNTRLVLEPALKGTFIKGNWKGYFDVSTRTDKSFKILHNGLRVELIINGRSVWQGKGSGEKIYQYTFKPGRHEIMFVAYPEMESKPVKFNVSITDNAKDLKYDELVTHLKELGDFDSIYCGVQKSKRPNQTVDIILKNSAKPVVLFLTSYKQVVWDFKNSNTDKLAAVVTSAKNADEAIKNLPPHIPIYHFFSLANTAHFIPVRGKRGIKNTFKSTALQILSLTGNLPAGFSGAEQAGTITVPKTRLDRRKYRHLGFTNISLDYNIFIEYPKKIDVVFNPVTTKYIDPTSTSKFKRAIQIKPEVQRGSWAAPLRATEDIPTGAFKAYYFDIFNPGQPKFNGIVEDVSINSSGRSKVNSTSTARLDEYGIIPENFGAFWIGKIALEEDKEMEIHIDSSNASSRVLIDDVVVKARKISLKKGLHKIEIEHVNNWHTYGFSFTLTETQKVLAYEVLKEQLENILPKRVHTAYVGVYDSKNSDNSIILNVENVGRPIFMILSSYRAVNWVIEGPGAKDVQALLISSLKSKSKIKGNVQQEVPKIYFPMWSYTYLLESKCECQGGGYYCSSKALFDTIDYIKTITGQKINSFTGNYNAKSFMVPESIIDRKQLKILKKVAKENLLAQAKCEGPELTPQYLNKKQLKQVKEHASVQNALKFMELIRDNRLDEYLQLMEPRKTKANPENINKGFLLNHNRFAGYNPSIAYHLIDEKMYEKIVANKAKLIIPLVLERNKMKDINIRVHMKKIGDKWLAVYIN